MNPSTLRPHANYFINGGDLFFLVGTDLFKVHSYFFTRESQFFRDKATSASSEANAFVLENDTTEEFEQFLWVFYNDKYSLYQTSTENWGHILKFANRWGFTGVKTLATRELEQIELSDIDRIVLYQQYGIDPKVLLPRYAALCAREQPLSAQEASRLGIEMAMKIAQAREFIRGKVLKSGDKSPIPAGVDRKDVLKLVKELFGSVST